MVELVCEGSVINRAIPSSFFLTETICAAILTLTLVALCSKNYVKPWGGGGGDLPPPPPTKTYQKGLKILKNGKNEIMP